VEKVEKKRPSKSAKSKGGKRKFAKPAPPPELPDEKKEAITDLLQYTLLLYGREKIGKSTFLSSYPDTLFLTTEPGTKGLEIFEYNHESGGCKNWKLLKAAVDLLEKTDRFKTVVIDTVDRAYDMCMEYICREKLGIDHPSEEAYGKGWAAVRSEFMTTVHRILQTGRGLCFTSHAKEVSIKPQGGEEYTRITPTMSGQARGVVEALVDLFFYVEYIRSSAGTTERVIITEGDEVIWAGAREIGAPLPRFIPLTKEGGFEILQAAFNGEDVGLDPKTLVPTATASSVVKKFFRKAGKEEARRPRRKSKKKSKEGGKRKVGRRAL